MKRKIASWIRECDEANFARFFTGHPELELLNARRAPIDLAETAALLLTGGPDISAEYLRQPAPDPAVIQEPEPERDAWEFQALAAALERGVSILAVCKGMQLFNVGLGGTLKLDIRGHNLPEQKLRNIQPVRMAANSTVRFDLVNSSHHQALDTLGAGLEVEAWSAADGIIEQVRLRDYPFALGVQYHPERDMVYAPLFDLFASEIQAAPV
jgi:putative glutamine amidotransferase